MLYTLSHHPKQIVNAIACPDEKYKLSNTILEHNHALSPRKTWYYKSNKKLDPQVKRRLKLNDEACIKVSKTYYL